MSTVATKLMPPPASLDLSEDRQDDLSMRSDSSSLWNLIVTSVSFVDLFDLPIESDPNVWTLDMYSMILHALQRDIDGIVEDPDCHPGLRFRHCSSPEPVEISLAEIEERSSIGSLQPVKVILVKEADEDSRVDLTEAA